MNKIPFYQKYAWIIFIVIGIMILVGGIPHAFGVNTDPNLVVFISGETLEQLETSSPMVFDLYHFYFSGGGLSDIGVAVGLILITLFGYKQRQKWAWFSLWYIPLFFTAWIILSLQLPIDARNSLITPLIVFVLLGVVAQLLSFRLFFPKQN